MTVLIVFLLTVVRALPSRNGTHLSDHTSNVLNPSDYLPFSSKATHSLLTKSSIPTFSEKVSNFQTPPAAMTTGLSQKQFSTPINHGTDKITNSHYATISVEYRKTISRTFNTIEPSSPISHHQTDELKMASYNDASISTEPILRTPSLTFNTKPTYLNSKFHATSILSTPGAFLNNNGVLDDLNSTSIFTTIFVSSSMQSDFADGYILATEFVNETKDFADFSTSLSSSGKQKRHFFSINR